MVLSFDGERARKVFKNTFFKRAKTIPLSVIIEFETLYVYWRNGHRTIMNFERIRVYEGDSSCMCTFISRTPEGKREKTVLIYRG